MDGHTITAVYSGDGNFAGSQSQGQQNATVVGNPLSIGDVLTDGSNAEVNLSAGDVATVSGSVSGLDGSAFMVTVNWGDGSDAEQFAYGAGQTSFSAGHVYVPEVSGGPVTLTSWTDPSGCAGTIATQDDTIIVTVISSDGRTATPSNAPGVAILDSGPSVGFANDPDGSGGYTFIATGSELWDQSAQLNYQWNTPDVNTSGNSIALNATQWGDTQAWGGAVTVTDAIGAAAVWSDPYWLASGPALSPQPTVSVTETDTNQTVQAGQAATFDIHVDWRKHLTLRRLRFITKLWTGRPRTASITNRASGRSPWNYDNWEAGEGGRHDSVPTTAGIYGGTDETFSVELVSEVFSGVPGVVLPELRRPGQHGQGDDPTSAARDRTDRRRIRDAHRHRRQHGRHGEGRGDGNADGEGHAAALRCQCFVEFAGQRRGDPKLQSRQQRQPVNPPCHGRAGGEHYIRVRRRRKRFCRCVIGEHDRERGDFRFGAERDGHGNAASNRRGSRQDVSVSPRDVRNQACSG